MEDRHISIPHLEILYNSKVQFNLKFRGKSGRCYCVLLSVGDLAYGHKRHIPAKVVGSNVFIINHC